MNVKAIVEAILLAAEEPVTIAQLLKSLESQSGESTDLKADIKNAVEQLAEDYVSEDRGIQLVEVGGGYQIRTKPEFAEFIHQLSGPKPTRLSTPAIESLSIIAYRQPITRGEVDQIRGVDSGGVIKTLLERRLIKIVGRREEPGRPLLYATTSEFLELFGLNDLKELPPLQELEQRAAQILQQERESESIAAEDLEALEVDAEMLTWLDEQEKETFAELSDNLKELKRAEQRASSVFQEESTSEEQLPEDDSQAEEGGEGPLSDVSGHSGQ